MSASYKIHYFPARGRAEIIRFILALAGQEWEETEFTQETWPEAKASGKYLYGQVPALELEDGTILVQTLAITQYLARKYNLYADDLIEAARIDQFVASALDVLNGIITVQFYTPEDQKAEAMSKFVAGTLTNNFGPWEKILASGEKFLANGRLSVADAWAVYLVEAISAKAPEALEGFPTLTGSYFRSIQELPGLSTYLASEKRFP